MKRNNTKLVRQSKIPIKNNYSTTKTFENPNTIDIKSVTIEHPKNSHKLFESMRQAKKVSQIASAKIYNTPLYSETKKS